MNQAILLKFQLERIPINGQPVGPDPMAGVLRVAAGPGDTQGDRPGGAGGLIAPVLAGSHAGHNA